MPPVDIGLIIVGIENLISFLLQLRANGQLTDAQLSAAISTSNTATRTMIAKFIAEQSGLAGA